ncbi:hypothetical protein CSUI_006015 [Cystoisospora suis]|uniref:Uncharacterized protein n=1 Tax=Cystoisospora suis TaxID=483139 RepID=A0A2C6KVZ6_9APIC|nr:hypothetical protein CSUI_006015 [Cystoisospora suis]
MGIKDWMGSAYRRRRPCRTPSSLLSSRLSLPSPLSPSSSSSTLSSPSSPLMRRRSKRISRHKPLYLSLSSFSSSSSPSFPSLLSRSPPGSLTSCLSTSASPVPPSSLHSSSSSFLSTVSSPYTTFHTKSRRSPFKERGKVRQGGRISSSSSSSSSTSLTRKGPFSSSSSPFSSLFTSKASVLPSWSSSSSSSSTSSFLISPFSPSLSPALLPNSDLFLTQSCLLKHQLSSSSSFSSFSPSLIATLHSSQLSSSYCDRQQEGLSSAFQHRSRFFSSRLALRARNFLRMHRSTSPEDFLSLLNQDISFKVPDAKFLRVASGRFLSCIDDFYPPQIVDAFTIFSNIPFSDENLLAAYVSRLDDLLTDPSPRRLTALLSLSTRLGFSHPLAESPLTSSILDRMHYFDISLLPSLCRSIGKVFLSSSSSSLALLDSVSTQVYLTFKPYLFLKSSSSSLLASESSHLSMFIR